MTADPPLLPGPHRPLASAPTRAAGSVRRTVTVDTPWPDLESARAVMDVRARDLSTDASGEALELETVELGVTAELAMGEILAVDGPDADRAAPVVGGTLRRGFAVRLAETMPDEAVTRSLLNAALDDLPGAFLVSGYAMLRAGLVGSDPDQADAAVERQGDVCIGWATGSGMLSFLRRERRTPVPMGPVAPAIEAADPVGWHDAAPLEHLGMRRRRLLDVERTRDGSLQVTSHFRDSYRAEDHEMVLHEWLVRATVAPDGRIAAVDADPRTLPWTECPGAAASANQIIGVVLSDLPRVAKLEVAGNHTCTHLSSTLRTLADTADLAQHL